MAYKIIFFGTSDFAVPSLKALAEDKGYKIAGIVTQPDRPVGRHADLTPPPIKAVAEELGIQPIWQPEKIKDLKDMDYLFHGNDTTDNKIDAFVIISYGKILPDWLLQIPSHGVVNVHPSLLPRWRGPSPIQAAITAGDETTGVTIMKIDTEMDHGPILAQKQVKIDARDDSRTMSERLSKLGADMLKDVLAGYLEGKIQPREQDHAKATYCKILSRDDGRLDFTRPAIELDRQVRACNPWPGAWTIINGKRLKILVAAVGHENKGTNPGELFHYYDRPFFSCVDGSSLELTFVQPEGKKPMYGEVWFQGARKSLGF
ncbi:MAG: methionyl-tRNA formyltransferase [Patescibacteria group bacterium]